MEKKRVPGKPQRIVLPGCPRCGQPLVKTKTGDFCPSCEYRRIIKC